jgi:hypothetical protein
MLTKETRDLLKSVSGISSTAVIEYPVTPVCPQDKSVIAFVDIRETEDAEFEKFGSYFMNEMLSVIDFFDGEEPAEVKLNDGVLEITGTDGSCQYETSDIALIETRNYVDPAKFEKMKQAPNVAEFELSKEMMQKINKLSGLLKLNHIVLDFRNNPELIITNFTDVDKYQTPTKLKLDVEVSEHYVVVLDIKNFQSIPVDNYRVRVIKSPKGNLSLLLENQNKPISVVVSILEQIEG